MNEEQVLVAIADALDVKGEEQAVALDRARARAANFAPHAVLRLAADMLDEFAEVEETPMCIATELAKILRLIEPNVALVHRGVEN